MTPPNPASTSAIDFYSDEVIADPYPHYRNLRDSGAAVWLSRNEAWVLSRFKDVAEALRNPGVFSSARGVMMNDFANDSARGAILCSDDPEHQHSRRLLGEVMLPGAVSALKPRFETLAEALVERLVDQGNFDAVPELAQYLPLTVVTELVGLSDFAKGKMLEWASAMFDVFGPMGNARTMAAFPLVGEVMQFVQMVKVEDLQPGGWGARLFDCAKAGHISEQQARGMLLDYIGPALDTTINATSAAIWLFAQFPQQWEAVRDDPSLIPNAINEAIRLESPIRAFSRYVTRDFVIEGETLQAGSRALIVYASANRDERKWQDPERFDVRRKTVEHVGFGLGTHMCAGGSLARMEMTALFEALARRVRRFELIEAQRGLHNTLRGLSRLNVRVC